MPSIGEPIWHLRGHGLWNTSSLVLSSFITIPFLRAQAFSFWYSMIISTSVHSGTSKFVAPAAYLNNTLLVDLGLRSLSITTWCQCMAELHVLNNEHTRQWHLTMQINWQEMAVNVLNTQNDNSSKENNQVIIKRWFRNQRNTQNNSTFWTRSCLSF